MKPVAWECGRLVGLCVVLVSKTLLRDRMIDSGLSCPLMEGQGLHMAMHREKSMGFAVRQI